MISAKSYQNVFKGVLVEVIDRTCTWKKKKIERKSYYKKVLCNTEFTRNQNTLSDPDLVRQQTHC